MRVGVVCEVALSVRRSVVTPNLANQVVQRISLTINLGASHADIHLSRALFDG